MLSVMGLVIRVAIGSVMGFVIRFVVVIELFIMVCHQ